MFRTVTVSTIRNFSLYTQQWYMSYRFADSLRAGTGRSSVLFLSVIKHVWHTPLLCIQWKIPDDGRRNCPKHVEFYSKNKFEKLVHLVGLITGIPWQVWVIFCAIWTVSDSPSHRLAKNIRYCPSHRHRESIFDLASRVASFQLLDKQNKMSSQFKHYRIVTVLISTVRPSNK